MTLSVGKRGSIHFTSTFLWYFNLKMIWTEGRGILSPVANLSLQIAGHSVICMFKGLCFEIKLCDYAQNGNLLMIF